MFFNMPEKKLTARDKVAINRAAAKNLVQSLGELRDHAEALGLVKTTEELRSTIRAAKAEMRGL